MPATLLLSTAHMRATAILGLGYSLKDLKPFQSCSNIEWHMGIPASSNEADVILLFGGDGTIHRHLNQLVKLELPVLIVPAGSGNDFARALSLRRRRDSLAAWRRFVAGEGNIRPIDLGIITSLSKNSDTDASPNSQNHSRNSVPDTRHYFASVAGVGIDGEVARRANEMPRWMLGHGGYALALLPTIFRFSPHPMKTFTSEVVNVWNTRSNKPTILAAFANTSTYGGGMKIAPRAKFDDGLLDICVIGNISPFKLALVFPSVYFGRHLGIRGVDYIQAERVMVETETPLDVYADGEYVCPTPVEVTVHRDALKVLTP